MRYADISKTRAHVLVKNILQKNLQAEKLPRAVGRTKKQRKENRQREKQRKEKQADDYFQQGIKK